MDVNTIASATVQGAVAPDAGGAPASVPSPPSEDAVARFQEAMGGAGNTPPQVQAAQPANDAAQVERVAPEGSTSPGDAILHGLGKMSQNFEQALQQVKGTAQGLKPGDTVSTSDMLKAQLALMQVSVQQDAVGKVVTKVTQSVDSFLKNQ